MGVVDTRVLPAYSFLHRAQEFNIENPVTTLWLNSSGVCLQLLELRRPGGKGTARPKQQHLCTNSGTITEQERHWMHQSWDHLLSGNATRMGLSGPELIPSTSPAPAQLSRDQHIPPRGWDHPGRHNMEMSSSLLLPPHCEML